ncbi:MAG: hypothetical protein BMS9Abin28_0959 [Anaerolineae bacterium]|nr:MAG: hypothetical protein BMS9Abin28_0959 [Anaerolineae bacterium]
MRPAQLETSGPSHRSEVSAYRPFGSRRTVWLLLLAPILVAGCSRAGSVSSEPPHYAGTFEASCSPVDAPAIIFDLYRLGDPEPPQVSIAVRRFDSSMAGSQIELSERGGYGAAFIGGTEWIPAKDGAIGLENYTEGKVAGGWFWLELDGIDRIEGRFEVTWSDAGPVICG